MFLTELDLRKIDAKRFQLLSPLVYETADERLFTVPAGFCTDLASIPQVVQWRYSKVGLWDWGAVLHDWLYRANGVSRAEADQLFAEALMSKGVPWRTRTIMYWAVRLSGQTIWNRYRSTPDVLVVENPD